MSARQILWPATSVVCASILVQDMTVTVTRNMREAGASLVNTKTRSFT